MKHFFMLRPLTRTMWTCLVVWISIPNCVNGADVDHGIFDAILKANVREERVDYLNIRKNHWPELNEYLEMLAKVDPATLSRDQQLALYINLYNASMIRAMTQRFRADYSPSESLYGVFKEKLVRVNHQTITLDYLEHKIIRPTFKDPRVHAALVCAARSCPPILDHAYVADGLDELLGKKMRDFVNDPTRNRVEHDKRTLHLSKIFDWYAGDFGGKSKLGEYVSTYLGSDVTGFRVAFLKYAWTLNVMHPAQGRWVKIVKGSAKILDRPAGGEEIARVKKSQVFEVIREQDNWLLLDMPFDQTDGWINMSKTQSF